MYNAERVTNREARKYVQEKKSFTGNNLYGRTHSASEHVLNSRYVVTSYGDHWPLFIYEDGQWFENNDRNSVTTGKHRSQTHPHEDCVPMSAEDMITIMRWGISGVAVGMDHNNIPGWDREYLKERMDVRYLKARKDGR